MDFVPCKSDFLNFEKTVIWLWIFMDITYFKFMYILWVYFHCAIIISTYWNRYIYSVHDNPKFNEERHSRCVTKILIIMKNDFVLGVVWVCMKERKNERERESVVKIMRNNILSFRLKFCTRFFDVRKINTRLLTLLRLLLQCCVHSQQRWAPTSGTRESLRRVNTNCERVKACCKNRNSNSMRKHENSLHDIGQRARPFVRR